MSKSILFVTGNDTAVGKTVFAAALTRRVHEKGIRVAALKPLCSGGRDDARLLRAAANNALSLDEVNPWHFRAPLSPLQAARRENKKVKLASVIKHVRHFQQQFEWLVVEGAGGLLSPLGENFNSLDCLVKLKAVPIVVCANRLGAINQVLLVLAALPKPLANRAEIILMSPPNPDAASRRNIGALQEFVPAAQLHSFPWIKKNSARKNRQTEKALDQLLAKF